MAWKGDCDDKLVCSLVGTTTVVFSLRVQQKVQLLLEEYPRCEWLGYLVGRLGADVVACDDLIIPPHEEAAYASAEAEPFVQPEGTVGVLHSHHQMGAFHSGTDKAHVDVNFPVSVTVADKANTIEYDAVAMGQTPCGQPLPVKCDVVFETPGRDFDAKEFVVAAKVNIEKGRSKAVKVYDYTAGVYSHAGGPKKTADLPYTMAELFGEEGEQMGEVESKVDGASAPPGDACMWCGIQIGLHEECYDITHLDTTPGGYMEQVSVGSVCAVCWDAVTPEIADDVVVERVSK